MFRAIAAYNTRSRIKAIHQKEIQSGYISMRNLASQILNFFMQVMKGINRSVG